jgi:type III pantothenate kinase
MNGAAGNLLFDIGNTRAKWAWLRDGVREPIDADAEAHLDAGWDERVASRLARAARPARVVIAAVGPPPEVRRLRDRLESMWPDVAIEELRTPARAAGITSAYAAPERLGIDRFLAMVGARALAPGAVVTEGLGSALALDVLDADGLHRGGLIAPTAPRMRDAVLSTTARVDWRDAPRIHALGRTTEDALWSGCWQALAGLTERACADAARDLGITPRLVLHGGDADALRALLRIPCAVQADLVLRGLAHFVLTR